VRIREGRTAAPENGQNSAGEAARGLLLSRLIILPCELMMECRTDCGACCIAPSISSPIPGMPDGKPANTRCVQLDEQLRCRLFHSPLRPKVCGGLQASREMCHSHRDDALIFLARLEAATAP